MSDNFFSINDDNIQFIQPPVVLTVGYHSLASRCFRHTSPSPYELEMAIAHIEDALQAEPLLRHLSTDYANADPYLHVIAQLAGAEETLSQQHIESVFNRVADVVSGSPKRPGEYPDEADFVSYLTLVREISHHLNIQNIRLVSQQV